MKGPASGVGGTYLPPLLLTGVVELCPLALYGEESHLKPEREHWACNWNRSQITAEAGIRRGRWETGVASRSEVAGLVEQHTWRCTKQQ